MYIANPLYDSAFKYLMEDVSVSKGIIGRIINSNIIELEFKPQEYSYILSEKGLNFMRMDFQAIIETENGERKKVLIELQKSKQSMDIMRFRKYIGEQYQRIDNWKKELNEKGELIDKPEAYTIIVIYFLGYIEDARLPRMVRVENQYFDGIENIEIKGVKSKFLERLTHSSYMLQLGIEGGKKSGPLERILSLFKQREKNKVIMEYEEVEIEKDELLQRALKRLSKAIVEENVRKQMEYEEEMEEKVSDIFNKIERQERELEEKDKVLEVKDKVIEINNTIIQKLAKMLKESGRSIEEITKQTGLSEKEIEAA